MVYIKTLVMQTLVLSKSSTFTCFFTVSIAPYTRIGITIRVTVVPKDKK